MGGLGKSSIRGFPSGQLLPRKPQLGQLQVRNEPHPTDLLSTPCCTPSPSDSKTGPGIVTEDCVRSGKKRKSLSPPCCHDEEPSGQGMGISNTD